MKGGFNSVKSYNIMANQPYIDVLTLKLEKCVVVVVARATRPPDRLRPNQAQLASPMV
jgi:hypothetical protein